MLTVFVVRPWPQSMKALKGQWESVEPNAPMRVVSLEKLRGHGELPRSSHNLTQLLSEVGDDAKIIFVSHRWLRAWQTLAEFDGWFATASEQERALVDEAELRDYYSKGGQAHPDDTKGSKYRLVCAGVEKLAEKLGWTDLSKVHIWLGAWRSCCSVCPSMRAAPVAL